MYTKYLVRTEDGRRSSDMLCLEFTFLVFSVPLGESLNLILVLENVPLAGITFYFPAMCVPDLSMCIVDKTHSPKAIWEVT